MIGEGLGTFCDAVKRMEGTSLYPVGLGIGEGGGFSVDATGISATFRLEANSRGYGDGDSSHGRVRITATREGMIDFTPLTDGDAVEGFDIDFNGDIEHEEIVTLLHTLADLLDATMRERRPERKAD